MRILLVHNRYAYRGGEDAVFEQERDLLLTQGHLVVEYTKDNREIDADRKLGLALGTIWAQGAYNECSHLMADFRPDIVHVHNTLPLISPAVYYAAARHAKPVVQTLHNYRLICPNGMLVRDAAVCEACVGKPIAWPSVRYKCYRGSRGASVAVAAALALHRAAGTWRHRVARYIALTQFSRDKLLAAGMPAERLVVKPNFAKDRHGTNAAQALREGALYVGRLSEEKGPRVLVDAWQELDVALELIGDGPLAEALRSKAPAQVHFRGFVSDDELAQSMWRASFLVMPSLVYEGFPMVVAEAFAAGLPIVASRLGALAELVEDGVTGLQFNAGDPADLAAKVRWAASNPDKMAAMGKRARAVYEQRYTPERNYARLMEIYAEAIQHRAVQ